MKNKLLPLFLLTLFLFSSCQDEEEGFYYTTVQGRVLDKDTYLPIPGATVRFFKVKNSDPGSHIYFHSMTTDVNGTYSFAFTAEKATRNYTTASHPDYLTMGFVYTPYGQDNYINLLLTKPGFLKIHVKNVSPFDASDKIDIFNSDYYYNNHVVTGMNADTNIIITRYGNLPGTVYWNITKNDSTYSSNQTFNFISNDTLYFDLFY